MRTVYSNTRHPKLVKWSVVAAVIISFTCLVLYFVVDGDNWVRYIFHYGCVLFLFTPVYLVSYLLSRYIIDEEADTLTFSGNKKYPMKISNMSTISYKESKKGRFRSLQIHDNGVSFMDIRTTKENADRIASQLTKANTSIVVNHVNCW